MCSMYLLLLQCHKNIIFTIAPTQQLLRLIHWWKVEKCNEFTIKNLQLPSLTEETTAWAIYIGTVATKQIVLATDFFGITAQEEGDRRKKTSDQAQTLDLNSFTELQPQAISPSCNPSSPIALCTGRKCAAIQRPLRTDASRLVLWDVMVVGSADD